MAYEREALKRHNRQSGYWFQGDVEEDLGRGMPFLPTAKAGVDTSTAEEVDRELELWAKMLNEDDPNGGPLAFVDASWFQTFVGVVISVNALIIGFETDYQSPAWFWVEQALLIFFVFELGSRVARHGKSFVDPEVRFGNLVDFGIVMAGVIDMWMVPGFEAMQRLTTHSRASHERNPLLQAMGILRMLRIIRLVRLVKIVQPLYRLATGVFEAMQGMFWVLVFLAMLLYAVAVVCTRLIGHGAVFDDDDQDTDPSEKIQQIREMFHSVFSSMFVLFELMSCWSLMKFTPLFDRLPLLKLLFVLFYIFSAWALLAVMTGVVSEKMIAVREQITSEEKSEKKRGMAVSVLIEKFHKADLDKSGFMSYHEFEEMTADADTMRQLMLHANVNAQDLQDLFEWLDHNKDGEISIKEFLEGFSWLNEPVTPKSFVKLQEKLCADLHKLEHTAVSFINERFDRLIQAVRQPLRKINAVTAQLNRLDSTCAEMSRLLGERTKTRLTREGLAECEQRLSARIDALLEAVDSIDNLHARGLLTIKAEARGDNASKAGLGSIVIGEVGSKSIGGGTFGF